MSEERPMSYARVLGRLWVLPRFPFPLQGGIGIVVGWHDAVAVSVDGGPREWWTAVDPSEEEG